MFWTNMDAAVRQETVQRLPDYRSMLSSTMRTVEWFHFPKLLLFSRKPCWLSHSLLTANQLMKTCLVGVFCRLKTLQWMQTLRLLHIVTSHHCCFHTAAKQRKERNTFKCTSVKSDHLVWSKLRFCRSFCLNKE